MSQGNDRWTLGRLLEWTTEYLGQLGADNSRLDAEVLLAEACHCQRIDLYTRFDSVADERVRTAFRELVRRRAEGTPVAYLVGRREFYSLPFYVTPDVLVPRPESEFVIVALLDLVREYTVTDRRLEIADVGTGSGNLAVCAARELVTARITAIDTSEAALKIARANAKTHGVLERIEFVCGDLLRGTRPERLFDFIISNPPYVSHQEWDKLAPDVKDHEPRVALDGGADGTSIISRLIEEAAQQLHPGGWLICEISPMIHDRVRRLVETDGNFDHLSTVNDLAQLPRVVTAKRRRATVGSPRAS